MFCNNGTEYSQIGDYKADSIHKILDELLIYDDKLLFVGDASKIYHDEIQKYITNCEFANDDQNVQTSISVGKSAYAKYQKGQYGDSNSLLPIYLKKSQAERALDGEK